MSGTLFPSPGRNALSSVSGRNALSMSGRNALSVSRVELYLKMFLSFIWKCSNIVLLICSVFFSQDTNYKLSHLAFAFLPIMFYSILFLTLLFVFFLFCSIFLSVLHVSDCIFISVFSLLFKSNVTSIIKFNSLFSSTSFLTWFGYFVIFSYSSGVSAFSYWNIGISFASSLSLWRVIFHQLCYKNISLCFSWTASSSSLFGVNILNRLSAHSSWMRGVLLGSAICERTVLRGAKKALKNSRESLAQSEALIPDFVRGFGP